MRKKLEGVLIILVGLAFCSLGVVTMMKPTMYRASVKMNILPEPKYEVIDGVTNQLPFFIEPETFQLEFEVMQSEVVLGKIVGELDLNRKWGNRYQRGLPF